MKNEAQIRILLLQQYLCTLTDEEHAASVSDILQFWESHGIQAGRKSVYGDIQILIDQGVDIVAPDQGIGAELVPIAVVLEDFFFLCGVPQECVQRHPDPD